MVPGPATLTGAPVKVASTPVLPRFAGNTNYNQKQSGSANITINKATLTVTATGVHKPYDGTTTATVTLSDNRVAGDVFTDAYTSASFVTPDAAPGKTINVGGISITGTDAGNYA